MKLDTKAFRYLSAEDWRILTSVEVGSKNHEVVPTPLIIQLSGLRAGHSGAQRSISTLAKADLIAREKNVKYDGYRLTYGGLDYLALHSHTKSNSIVHLGSQMGVGKESDIYLVTSPVPSSTATYASQQSPDQPPQPPQAILKIHRLGRTSFRSIRNKRAYHGSRTHASWLYLSRLSAHKEYLCMRALYDAGFPVPTPIAWNRHTIVMSLVPGIPLRQVPLSAFEIAAGGKRAGKEARDDEIARVYGECMEMILQLAEVGVIHGDFNEFNILVGNVPDPADFDEDEEENLPLAPENTEPISTSIITTSPGPTAAPSSATTNEESQPIKSPSTKETPARYPKPPQMKPHLIDFPQITSLSHPQAAAYFARDVSCIRRFFRKRYHFEATDPTWPSFADAEARLQRSKRRRIDVEVEAMGFSRKMAKELEVYFEENGEGGEEGVEEAAESEGGEEEGREEMDGGKDEDGTSVAEDRELDALVALNGGNDHGGENGLQRLNGIDGHLANVDKVGEDAIGAADSTDLLINMAPIIASARESAQLEGLTSHMGKTTLNTTRIQQQPRMMKAKAKAGWSI